MDLFHNNMQDSLNFDSLMSPASNFEFSNYMSPSYFNSSTTSSNYADMVLPSIFVKMPNQINQQYQNSNETNEIKCEEKSEPIKREIYENQLKDFNDDNLFPDLFCSEEETPISCYRCELCPFLSINQEKLNEHIEEFHTQGKVNQQENRLKLKCPGCENVFSKTNSLEIHLSEDHLMPSEDAEGVARSILSIEEVESGQNLNGEANTRQSRIYIKNVQLLKKPDVIEKEKSMNASNLHESQYSFVVPSPTGEESLNSQPMVEIPNESTPTRTKIYVRSVETLTNPIVHCPHTAASPALSDTSTSSSITNQQNKIFIKSVDILREPIYPLPTEFSSPPITSTGQTTSKIYIRNVDNMRDPAFVGQSQDTSTTPPISSSSQSSQQNKIFIRHVDILREPMFPNLSESPPVVTSSTPTPPIESSCTESTPQRSHIFIKKVNILGKPFSAISLTESSPDKNKSKIFIKNVDNLRDSIFMSNSEVNPSCMESRDLEISSESPPAPTPSNESASTENLVPNENVEANNSQENKIFIKDLSALQQQPMIHLKTVDELNLMTLDQLQELLPINNNEKDLDESDQSFDFQTKNYDSEFYLIEPNENQMKTDENIEFLCPEDLRLYLPDEESVDQYRLQPMVVIPSNDEKLKKAGRPKGSRSKLSDLGNICDYPDCGMRFAISSNLDYHKRCHFEDGTMKCPECGSQEAKHWNSLHTHLWREHRIDMELYSCGICDFKTPLLSRLKNTHEKIHSDERNFICNVCGKAFKNNKQLTTHHQLHKNKPLDGLKHFFTCEHCGQKFMTAKTLRNHVETRHNALKLHEPYPGFKCLVCQKVFSTKALLKSHTHNHSDEKRYQCLNCNYTTNDHNAFRRHKMRHDKAKMYTCSYCDYTSIQSTTYRKHLEKHHADVASNLLFKCEKCPFISINEAKYELHKSKHGTDELDERSCVDPQNNNDEIDVDSIEMTEKAVSTISSTTTSNIVAPTQLPMIRPAFFANNLSHVANFY